MKTLEIIQKTCKVFQTLAKIAGILCIVGAVASGVGALCSAAQYHGGSVFGFFGEPLKLFADGTDLQQKYVELLAIMLRLTAEAILLGLTYFYLKAEQADGTPFTMQGAQKLQKLGIRWIYIPLIAIALSEAIAVWQGVEVAGGIGNFESVMTGIVLIFASVIFRYGAELEKNSEARTPDTESTGEVKK